jgi:hypothetical protein
MRSSLYGFAVLPATTVVEIWRLRPLYANACPRLPALAQTAALEPELIRRVLGTPALETAYGVGSFKLQNEFAAKRLTKRRAYILRRVPKDRRDGENS